MEGCHCAWLVKLTAESCAAHPLCSIWQILPELRTVRQACAGSWIEMERAVPALDEPSVYWGAFKRVCGWRVYDKPSRGDGRGGPFRVLSSTLEHFRARHQWRGCGGSIAFHTVRIRVRSFARGERFSLLRACKDRSIPLSRQSCFRHKAQEVRQLEDHCRGQRRLMSQPSNLLMPFPTRPGIRADSFPLSCVAFLWDGRAEKWRLGHNHKIYFMAGMGMETFQLSFPRHPSSLFKEMRNWRFSALCLSLYCSFVFLILGSEWIVFKLHTKFAHEEDAQMI